MINNNIYVDGEASETDDNEEATESQTAVNRKVSSIKYKL